MNNILQSDGGSAHLSITPPFLASFLTSPALPVPLPSEGEHFPQPSVQALAPSDVAEAGEAGEAGAQSVSNEEFVDAVFRNVPPGAFAAVCTKDGDPDVGGWKALKAEVACGSLPASANNYVCGSSLYPGTDGSFRARKGQFAACHFLLLDDLGGKFPVARLGGFEPSWLLETSRGNYQAGIILSDPITSVDAANLLHTAIVEAGLCDPGASSPATRWGRIPKGVNGKRKHASDTGKPFQCTLKAWNPDARYTVDQIVKGLNLTLPPAGKPKPVAMPARISFDPDEVLTRKSHKNPVIAALQARGLYKKPLGSGKHDMTCPWADEHTDGADSGAAYFEPDVGHPVGGFCCQHSHGETYRTKALLDFLGIDSATARHRAVIRLISGDLDRVVDAAEEQLAAAGNHYQSGGLIVSVATDPSSGNPSIVPTTLSALTRDLSTIASWQRFDGTAKDWVAIDPPTRHVGVLHAAQTFRHLPALEGVARQPFFREPDGQLVTQPGYDDRSHRFAVFDPAEFPISAAPTIESAREALALFDGVIGEFPFAAPHDRAATLAAILTAVVRPTLAHAPAFHVQAPTMGSGKTYLCELIGAFAGPAGNSKVSYPTTSEEATKMILSLLMTGTGVIEFDDMDGDWIPYGTIKRMLTAPQITDRVLGYSKTATVSTRCLFLGSGNNVGPVRDLIRRVLVIKLDARSATPATTSYSGKPVDQLRRHRGRYVSAALTIIRAWREAGSPRTAVGNIANYGSEWSDYCRHPLIWLGCPDPATGLLEQIRSDPDAEALGNLMTAWRRAFGSAAITVRKLVEKAEGGNHNLQDALAEFPVVERGEINRSKLGWFLKKNVNRIVGGYELQRTASDGRTAWRVVPINGPASPPSPPSEPPAEVNPDPLEDLDSLTI